MSNLPFSSPKLNFLCRSLDLTWFYFLPFLKCFLCCTTPHADTINVSQVFWSLPLFQCSLEQLTAVFPPRGQSIPSVLDAPPSNSKLACTLQSKGLREKHWQDQLCHPTWQPWTPVHMEVPAWPVQQHSVASFHHMACVHWTVSGSVGNCALLGSKETMSSTANSLRYWTPLSTAVHFPGLHTKSSWKGYLSHTAERSHIQMLKDWIPFPIALSKPASLESDPSCLASLPSNSRLLAPLSQRRSSQVMMCSPGQWLKSSCISCSSLRDRE